MELEDSVFSSEFGSHCEICSQSGRLHERFVEFLQEVDNILHHDVPDEVAWTSGGLSCGKLEYHFGEVSLVVFFDRYGDPMVSHKIENKTLSRKWVDGLRVELREQ